MNDAMNDAKAAVDAATQHSTVTATPVHAAAVVVPAMAAAATQADQPAAKLAEPPKPPSNGSDANNPAWLPDRLKAAKATAQRELLEASGFKSADELTAALTELKTLRDEKLTDAERKDQRLKDLEGKATRLESIQKSFAQVVGERFDKLSEEQRTRIDDVASGDPELRWSLLRIVEAAPAAAAAVPAQPPAAPPPQAPGNTSPAGTPPAPPRPADPESAFGIWQRKQQEDPTTASLYYRMNSVAIERSRPSSQ